MAKWWTYFLVMVSISMLGIACHGQLTPEEQAAVVLGKQIQALRSKDYHEYMRYFLPTCVFIVSRDHKISRDHKEDATTAVQWQRRIEQEIGDATVEKATLSVWNFLAQYLTLKTVTGGRKIIRIDVTYTLENTADGLRVSRAYLKTFRVTSAGQFADEHSLLGKWFAMGMDDPKGNTVTNNAVIAKYGLDMEFLPNGVVTFRVPSGWEGVAHAFTGKYRLVDEHHLAIVSPLFSEVWTIERPVSTHSAEIVHLEQIGVAPEVLVGFPQNYYIALVKSDRFKMRLER